MRWQRDERGQQGVKGVVNAALAIAAIFGAGLVYFAFENLGAESKTLDAKQTRIAAPYIGPALPNGAKARECVIEAARGHGLVWTDSGGWRAPKINPEPRPSGDTRADRGTMDGWKYQMDSYISTFQFEFDRCNQPPLPEAAPVRETPSSGVTRNWTATYTLTVQSQSEKCAPWAFPNTMSVSNSGSNISITLAMTGITFTPNGQLTSDGGFDLNTTEQRDVIGTGIPSTITSHLRGRFDTFNDEKLIRSGLFEGSLDGDTCTVAFEGRAP